MHGPSGNLEGASVKASGVHICGPRYCLSLMQNSTTKALACYLSLLASSCRDHQAVCQPGRVLHKGPAPSIAFSPNSATLVLNLYCNKLWHSVAGFSCQLAVTVCWINIRARRKQAATMLPKQQKQQTGMAMFRVQQVTLSKSSDHKAVKGCFDQVCCCPTLPHWSVQQSELLLSNASSCKQFGESHGGSVMRRDVELVCKRLTGSC